jgi:hypothetical protein
LKGVSLVKVVDGKLLRTFVTFDDNKIFKVVLTGDFFLHPEEKISEIEGIFFGKSIFFDDSEVESLIDALLEKKKIVPVGINSRAIVKSVKLAIANGTGHNADKKDNSHAND